MFARGLAALQGFYYLLTGIWALVDVDSFQRVTGPKDDLWLVKTVGGLIIAISVVLLAGAWRRETVRETALLGIAASLSLGLADIIYSLGGDISRVYLLEGVVEAVVVLAWLLVWRTQRLV